MTFFDRHFFLNNISGKMISAFISEHQPAEIYLFKGL